MLEPVYYILAAKFFANFLLFVRNFENKISLNPLPRSAALALKNLPCSLRFVQALLDYNLINEISSIERIVDRFLENLFSKGEVIMKKKRMMALVGPAFEDLSRKEMLEDQGEKNAQGKVISHITFAVPAVCVKVMDNLDKATVLFCQPKKE
jgi:hypothetical protein